jgi:virginiamycin B lyase
MPVDVRDLMRRAAGEPASGLDTDAILRRASQLRRRSLATVTAAVALVVVGLAIGLVARLDSESVPRVAARPHARGQVGTITQFPTSTENREAPIARGPDRSLWFILRRDETLQGSTPRLGRIGIDGTISEISIQNPASGITAGKDGNIYFGQPGSLGRVSPANGRFESFPLPEPDLPLGLTTTPNGDIWITQEASSGHLWRFSPRSATFQRVALPQSVSRADYITSDSRGNIWVSDLGGRIVRVDRKDEISDFPVAGGINNRVGFGLTAGADGNIWFTGFHDVISRMTPTGQITEYSVPSVVGHAGQPLITGITTGADGNLWFANLAAQTIGRITPRGKITEYPIPGHVPWFLAAGPDGNVWFTTHNSIGRITTGAAPTAKRH